MLKCLCYLLTKSDETAATGAYGAQVAITVGTALISLHLTH